VGSSRWDLDGKVALVTGASAGLGARFARVLHAAGAHVIVTARRADRLTELARECQTRMETLAGDITDPAHRQYLADVARRHGRLDVLVNNAGMCDDRPLEQQSLADLRQVVEVNLVSVLDMCRLTADLLRAAPVASVINVSSMYGTVASRGPMAAYRPSAGHRRRMDRGVSRPWATRPGSS
jgi:NADP-dependent 3-hydroxy acid dehydrogenase YdfG